MQALIFLLCVLLSLPVNAQKLPNDAPVLLPQMVEEIETYWPEIPDYTFIAGLIDQESFWKIRAQLKTARELGCGLGQFTIAYNKDGSTRFDALSETKRLHSSLKEWDWRDCYATTYQMRAIVLKNKAQHRSCEAFMANPIEALKCDAGAYNGGAGSVTKRIRFCRATSGCNPKIWEGHLSTQCPQSKAKHEGYGESFCEINSRYPGRIFTRMPKFKSHIEYIRAQRDALR
jgi:hypothetical protein